MRRSHVYGGVGTWRWDAATKELALEPETEQLYGAAAGTIRSYRDWARRLAAQDLRRFESERDAALAQRRAFKIEFCIRMPSGEERWILTRGRGEYDASGRLLRLLGVDIDITEQLRTVMHVRFLNRMAAVMAQERDEARLIATVLAELGKHLDAHRVWHIDADGDADIVTVHHTFEESGPPAVVGRHEIARYLTAEARQRLFAGKEIVVHDVAQDPCTSAFLENYRRVDVAACIAMPFVSASVFKGGVLVCMREPRQWREDEVQTVRGLVARLFPAIEHIRVEVRLRENEARLAAILEQLPVGVGVSGPDGRFHLRNEMMRRYMPELMASCDVANQHRWRSVDTAGQPVPPSGWPGACALRGEIVTPGIEFVHTDDAGREHWLLVSAQPFRAGAGDSNDGAIVVIQDIDERKRAEAALRESEERFRAMADGTPLMIWVTDAQGTVQFVNRAYRDFFGTSLENVQREGWRRLIHPNDFRGLARAFCAALHQRRAFRAQVRLRRADGEWRWVESYAQPRYSAAGDFLGMAGSSPDITDRKLAEKALQEADRRKGEFLATLAHELRNPLAPIRNAVQIMKLRAGVDPVLDTSRDMIDRQVTHMVRLIDDLLDVNRIERGKLELRQEPVNLRVVLDQAVESCARQFEDAEQRLVVSVPAEPICLTGDGARLAQVFANLLDNASKYTGRGGVIRVTAVREGGQVRVSVRDTGIGIPPDKLDEVFELFAQVDRTLERAKPGLGIGLALVKQLVEMHGGRVTAHSDGIGHGSEFVVQLPARAQPAPAASGAAAADSGEGAPPPSPRRILIADDNADNAQSLAELLRLSGNEIWLAHDGIEAVELAERHRPDVVLLDIGMPKLNGYEACRRIRAQPWGRTMTLIALTGWGQQEDREKSRDVGFDHHLVKPIDHLTLARLLAHGVRRERDT